MPGRSARRPQEPDEPTSDPVYRYDPNVGERNAVYSPIEWERTSTLRPELPAVFAVEVEGHTSIPLMSGRHAVTWRATPGTTCQILGRWSDGTLHVRWRALRGGYTLEARLPAGTIREVSHPERDDRILPSNVPPDEERRSPLKRLKRLRG